MFSFGLMAALSVLYALMFVGLYWWGRGRARNWAAQLAAALKCTATGRTVTFQRDGMTVQLTCRLVMMMRPYWALEVHSVGGPEFAASLEDSSHGFLKRLGLERDTALKDPALDQRLFIAAPEGAQLGALVNRPAVSAALAALWPDREAKQGHIWWVQSGDRLTAALDVSTLVDWIPRLVELVERPLQLARALQESPRPAVPNGALPPALLQVRFWPVAVVLAGPVINSAGKAVSGLLAAATRSEFQPDVWFALGGMAFGVVVAMLYVLAARNKPIIRQRLYASFLVAYLAMHLIWVLPVPLNLLVRGAPQTRTVEVVRSESRERGMIDIWEIELAGLGKFCFPLDQGATFKVGDRLEVQWVRGVSGARSLTSIRPDVSSRAAP